jgi:nucleoside-diphosphate-sugar epimerase
MRIFVTGATGFVGSAIIRELIAAGHNVLGLVRSDTAAKSLAVTGAEVHRGDVEDLESLRSGAKNADGVIHAAFNHDFSKFKANCENDRHAVEALGSVLAGSDRLLVITSGSALANTAPGSPAVEDNIPDPNNQNPRVASEQAAAAAAARGARVAVMRLSQVHGDGDRAGFVPILIRIAREKGVSAYVGDGLNRWPAVARLDAAHLYRLALEKGTAARYHAVAEEGVPFRDIAGVIGRRLNLTVVSKTPEQAADHFGWFTHFAAGDMPASSQRTREELGWQPKGPALIPDIDRPSYFEI